MTHDKLTIVSVYGHHDGASAIPAITHSMSELPGARGLLISIAKPDNLPHSIEWRECGRMTYPQYSVFVMHCLASCIETSHCLIVQDDGWVLQGDKFFPEYYQFDYVGAPCHDALVGLPDSQDWGEMWDGMDTLEEPGLHFVGFAWTQVKPEFRLVIQNGGFSLRSKRLLEACNTHGLPYLAGPQTRNEDAQYCVNYRTTLEALGYLFAPEEVARQFAIEYVAPQFHNGFDLGLLVGHHATSRKLIGDKTIQLTMDRETVEQVAGEPQFLVFLKNHLGYTIQWPDGSLFET